jgi:hypothetical protein
MEELFNLIKDYGQIIRSQNLDGLASWNEVKVLLEKITCCELYWNLHLVKLNNEPLTIDMAYNYIHDELKMLGEDTDEKNSNWEKFHFFLQLVRIPKNNHCGIVRLCQVAYNLGQLRSVYHDEIYKENVRRFYDINRLDRIRTYTQDSCTISEENLQKVRELIQSKSLTKYIYKYKKYKKKYLQKKN